MASLKDRMGREAFSVGFDYAYSKLEKDIRGGAKDLLNLAEKYVNKDATAIPIDEIKEAMDTPGGVLFSFVERGMKNLDKALLKNLFLNTVYEIGMTGRRRIKEKEAQMGVTVPKFILMEPTSGWNLLAFNDTTGTAGKVPRYDLSLIDMDRIVEEGEEMGIHLYFLSGGEPLMRREDILSLCKKHPKSIFMCFTNGTLVDETLGKEIKRVGNLVPIICLEELEESIVFERGQSAWDRMLGACDALKKEKIMFGTAVCYTSQNCVTATAKDFVKREIDLGSMFSMYSAYAPIAVGDDPQLMVSPEQRAYVLKRIREIRDFKDGDGLFAFDFQKDAEYLGGSISGGRTYLHIDARGDILPSTVIKDKAGNIKEKSLEEIISNPNALAYLEPVDRLYRRTLLYIED